MKKYLLVLIIVPFTVTAIVFVYHSVAFGASTPHQGNTNDLFYNFTSWTHTDSSASFPSILVASATWSGAGGSNVATPNKYTFTDINGDNLPDFLYHEKQYNSVNRLSQYYAIFLNNGNNNFNLAYKCVSFASGYAYSGQYGDCAGSPYTDPNNPANQNMLTQVLYLANYVNSSPLNDVSPYTHLWIDINGDGLQDFIDTSLHINNNQTSPYPLQF